MKRRESVDVLTFATDPKLLGLTLSPAQRLILKASYGLGVDPEERRLWFDLTGRLEAPLESVKDLTVVAGRRSGKNSRLLTAIALFEAFCGNHEKYLTRGEEGVVLIVSQVFRRARHTAYSLLTGALRNSAILSREVVAERAHELRLRNGLVIRCEPCSFRSIRGAAVPVALLDECAFWSYEGLNPDHEVEKAIRPGMAQFPGAKMVKVSSPWIRAGLLWEDYRKHYGVDEDPHLVIQAPTWTMNPTVSQHFLDRERAKDSEGFEREYGARFSSEGGGPWLPFASVEACRQPWLTRAPVKGSSPPIATIDPAYRRDRFTAAITWLERPDGQDRGPGKVIIGRLEGWTPPLGGQLSLSGVLDQLAPILRSFGIREVHGDQYTAAPVQEALRERGFTFREHPFTAALKAEIYGTLKTLVVQEQIELPDHARALAELRGLQVTFTPAGTMKIGAPSRVGLHDDYATVIALGAHLVYEKVYRGFTIGGDPTINL